MPGESNTDSDWLKKQRPCPSCRESISILATKCRFCGEEVAKPKDEIRALSKEDLGGETIYHRAPSESVIEALGKFREEAEAPLKISAPKSDHPLSPVDANGLPLLDEYGQGLASVSSSFNITKSGAFRQPEEPGANERMLRLGGMIAGALVAIFILVKGVVWVVDAFSGDEAPPPAVFVNRAPEVLKAGGPLLEALGAAVEALKHADIDENRRIAKEVVDLIEAKIGEIMNDPGWSVEKVGEAASLANSTARIYPNPVTTRLKDETQAEANLYQMVLMPIGAGGVRFKITGPNGSRSEIGPFGVGDVIEGRMKVVRVTASKVTIEDPRRMSASGSRFREITFETTNPMAH